MRNTAFAFVLLAASSVAQTVTLTSVVVSGNQATVTYSKDFATCAHLKLLNGTLVHAQNWFCTQGVNVAITVPLTGFNSLFQLGTQVILCHGNNGSICSAPVMIIVDPALVATPPTISLAAGGVQTLAADASVLAAGASYLVAGTLSGTSPGLFLDPFVVALNFDAWTQFTLDNPNTPPLGGFQGILSATGTTTATISIPPGVPAVFAGIVVNNVVGIVTAGGTIVGISAPTSLTLVP
jgi:hypothetical protein